MQSGRTVENMADTMSFPQTIEEFMEQYKVVDTEQVYSNGVEFVPIFRVKQWLEHSEKHGRWIHHQYGNTEGYYECNNCGKINSYESNYCPKCGAKMDLTE